VKTRHPDTLKTVLGDVERGVGTGTGWLRQGFIEGCGRGALRPQTMEETAACIGCHGGVGAPTDGTFSFARKFDAERFERGREVLPGAPPRGFPRLEPGGTTGIEAPVSPAWQRPEFARGGLSAGCPSCRWRRCRR
jgi:hypothetical protein